MVPDVKTEVGGEVGEDLKAQILQHWEGYLRRGKFWFEVGQRMTLTKEEFESGPWWCIRCPQGGSDNLSVTRRKGQVGGQDWLGEGVFEEGKLRREVWYKMVGEEVWRKGEEYILTLNATNALVLELKSYYDVEGVGEVVASLLIRTTRGNHISASDNWINEHRPKPKLGYLSNPNIC